MRELRVEARELRIGDEIELFIGDPQEPLTRMPWNPVAWWTVIGLEEGGELEVPGIGGFTHWETTIIAECIREVGPGDLDLDETQWRDLVRRAGLCADTPKIRITEKKRFIRHHTVTVRRPGECAGSNSIRWKTKYAG